MTDGPQVPPEEYVNAHTFVLHHFTDDFVAMEFEGEREDAPGVSIRIGVCLPWSGALSLVHAMSGECLSVLECEHGEEDGYG